VSAPLKARPTVFNGIPMRSRLEARYAARLGDPRYWTYEPRAYADATGQYLPDFELGDVGHFIEVKPTHELAWNAAKRARIIFSSVPDALVWIVWPRSASDEDGWGLIELTSHSWFDYEGGVGGDTERVDRDAEIKGVTAHILRPRGDA
jgi:hypothetical protein